MKCSDVYLAMSGQSILALELKPLRHAMILVLEEKIVRYTRIKYGQFPDIVMMWEHKTSCSSQHLAHGVSGLGQLMHWIHLS